MKNYLLLPALATLLTGCAVSQPGGSVGATDYPAAEPPITQSLFTDKSATISEDNIQRILSSTAYRLPVSLRVALVRLDPPGGRRYYWADEQHLKSQQAYVDQLTAQLRQSARVQRVTLLPELLTSGTPTFTNIREAAVRTQADVAVVYSVAGDVYSNYRLFARSEVKAFATTQLLVLDVRTGLIPFAATVTRDAQTTRQPNEQGTPEAGSRARREAAQLTLEELGRQLTAFLAAN